MKAESAFVLCDTGGRIVAGNPVWQRWFAEAADCTRLVEAAARLSCPALFDAVQQFGAASAESAAVPLYIGACVYELKLHKLDVGVLLELTEAERAASGELAPLAEIGRLTARLIHDFKNQMGGLKLYASYLKKRLAGAAAGTAGQENAEIVDKILEGLNAMAENATLVSRLAKPLELQREAGNLTTVVEQALTEQRSRAVARQVSFDGAAVTPAVIAVFDPQQLRLAFSAMLARAVEVSPPQGKVVVELQREEAGCVLRVTDAGSNLTEPQRQALFELAGSERLNKLTLELAHAKRIIEAHAGTIAVEPAEETGTRVLVRLSSETR